MTREADTYLAGASADLEWRLKQMARQADIMLETEGDAWLERNRDRLGMRDPVSDLIALAKIKPTFVLEIGCANGWRLHRLKEKYGCAVAGVDTSKAATREAMASGLFQVEQGTASKLSAPTASFDLVICGFFLYLADTEDYFRIASEVDRVLMDDGHLIIHDLVSSRPFARVYEHDKRLLSHHFDAAKLWLAHPAYHLMWRRLEDEEGITILKKNMQDAFPLEAT